MKKRILLFISLLCVVIFMFFISNLYQDSSTTPQSYSNIAELEKDLDVKVYPKYDIVSYIEEGNKELLRDSNKNMTITGKKEGHKILYNLEFIDNVHYSIQINIPVSQNLDNCKKTEIGKGILYQYQYKEIENVIHVGIFVINDMVCEITLKNNEMDQEIIEEKMIEYFKDIENV